MEHEGVPSFLGKLRKRDKELFEAVHTIMQKVMSPGKLDVKTKLLIAIAVDAAKGARPGVENLSKQARKAGISDEEINEALTVAMASANLQFLSSADAAFEE
ncbi:MAG TPA: carboxymuconolactone decarboxylase family protein [Desulfobacteria bacterium]|nr:carboxymuconolactone decarboxylase family protein [Desulfobacteria bacterium]